MPPLPEGWGRYFFIDGDAGDDTHDGFIDAPLGTVFAPALAAAHAVKTTDRLEAVTPLVGRGEAAVRLWKPRAGGAVYDRATPGDGHGRCDRRLLSGYGQLIDRGSDHTNSVADRSQLGYVTVLGPYPIAGVSGGALQLTGANFPDPYALTLLRLKITSGATVTYAAPRWGDPSPIPDPSVVFPWFVPGPANPGDVVELETPGVRVDQYYELLIKYIDPDSSSGETATLAGMEVTGTCVVGCAGQSVHYTGVFVSAVGWRIVGSFVADNVFIDEVGDTPIFSGPGLQSNRPVLTLPEVASVDLNFSSFIGSGVLGGASIHLGATTLRDVTITGGSQLCHLDNSCQYDGLTMSQVGHACLADVTHLPGGDVLYLDPGDAPPTTPHGNSGSSYDLQSAYELYLYSSPPPPQPPGAGVVMKNGQYSVFLQPTVFNVGSGVRLLFDDVGSKFIDVSWDSLALTGFEVIDGQKVVCLYNGSLFPDVRLPCPRAKLMIFDTTEGPSIPVPVGVVVSATNDANTVQLAEATAADLPDTPDVSPIGFTVTNSDANGGLCLVSSDSSGGILALDPAITAPTYPNEGDSLYLFALGAATNAPTPRNTGDQDLGPVSVGRVQPTGYDPVQGSIAHAVFSTWEPKSNGAQVAPLAANFDVASSDVLTEVPGVYAYVRRGHSYRVHAQVAVVANAAVGTKIALASTIGVSVITLSFMFVGVTAPGVAVAAIFSDFGDPVTENVGNGWWTIDGSFLATDTGYVRLQFAQAASNPITSTVLQGSYLELVEQE
jgi:hypothetical protein